MIHHVTYEIDKKLIAEELQFWSMLGFNPTGLRRRSRKQPPIHWLVSGDETHAVELIPVRLGDDPRPPQGLGHVAFSVSAREWEIVLIKARQGANFEIKTYPKGIHGFFESPTGHMVEVFPYYYAIKAGPPLEEK